MLSGELPFNAPTVAGILMKQITEPAPAARTRSSRDVPEDLSLAVARCLEKDPENRWPSADALRRALESRTVTGYRPTGLGWRAADARTARTVQRPRADGGSSERRTERVHRRAIARRCARARDRPSRAALATGRATAAARGGRDRRGTGVPARAVHRGPRQEGRNRAPRDRRAEGRAAGARRVRQVRRGRAAACFMINVATGARCALVPLPVAAACRSGSSSSYSELWQAGYSWRDVLQSPRCPRRIVSGSAKREGHPA